jgi:hypothetical protein
MTSGLASNVMHDLQAYCNIKKVPISHSITALMFCMESAVCIALYSSCALVFLSFVYSKPLKQVD